MASGSQLRIKYDRLKARVAEVKVKTTRAKTQYDSARVHEAGVEAEFDEVRSALDAALDALDTGSHAVETPQPTSAVRRVVAGCSMHSWQDVGRRHFRPRLDLDVGSQKQSTAVHRTFGQHAAQRRHR